MRSGEKLGGCYADEVIIISKVIQNIIFTPCHRQGVLIPSGVEIPVKSTRTDFLAKWGLNPGQYILTVGRFVPERGFHDLIDAFSGHFKDFKLVIAGDADHETPYSADLRKKAMEDKRIILTGFITGDDLNQIYTDAALFVLPSYHDGLPIALLEALSYNISVLVSDVPANKESGLNDSRYFVCGDVEDLRKKMGYLLQKIQIQKNQQADGKSQQGKDTEDQDKLKLE